MPIRIIRVRHENRTKIDLVPKSHNSKFGNKITQKNFENKIVTESKKDGNKE